MKSYKVSLHSHLSNFVHFVFSKPDKKKYLEDFFEILKNKEGNLVFGVANYNDDNRYAKFLWAVKNYFPEIILNKKHEDVFFSVKLGMREVYFIKVDEIATNKGHVLVVGFNGYIGKRKLDEVLRKAHKQKCVILASHPLHEFGVSHFFVRKLFTDEQISLDSETLLKNKKRFNALELNSYFPEDWNRVKAFSKKTQIPLIADSDAHFLDEVFASWFKVHGLNFHTPYSLNYTLSKALKEGIEIHAKKHGYLARYRHAVQVLVEKWLTKIGLLKE